MSRKCLNEGAKCGCELRVLMLKKNSQGCSLSQLWFQKSMISLPEPARSQAYHKRNQPVLSTNKLGFLFQLGFGEMFTRICLPWGRVQSIVLPLRIIFIEPSDRVERRVGVRKGRTKGLWHEGKCSQILGTCKEPLVGCCRKPVHFNKWLIDFKLQESRESRLTFSVSIDVVYKCDHRCSHYLRVLPWEPVDLGSVRASSGLSDFWLRPFPGLHDITVPAELPLPSVGGHFLGFLLVTYACPYSSCSESFLF